MVFGRRFNLVFGPFHPFGLVLYWDFYGTTVILLRYLWVILVHSLFGGVVAYMAILVKSELLLVLIGFIFVIETVSVILQVGSYKVRRKRIFLMAPTPTTLR